MKPTRVVLGKKNQSKNTCPMSSGPEIKLSLFRGICAGTRDVQILKSYHVTNPMWSDGERKEKEGIVVGEAHQPNHNLNSMTSTSQHPHFSLTPFYCLPLSFRVHGQLLAEVPACKSNTKKKKEGFCKV